ncbi:unnamed protein product [Coregonus sp. 'balchen']|nr:unnamed protein product [Coregonus sp. 'balchen']
MFKNTCSERHSYSHGKIYWMLLNKRNNESLYETNSTFASVTVTGLVPYSYRAMINHCVLGIWDQILNFHVIDTSMYKVAQTTTVTTTEVEPCLSAVL